MTLQQHFRVSEFTLLRSDNGNNCEMTTSPPGHRREAKLAITATASLQKLWASNREIKTSAKSCNDRKMQQRWNNESETQQSLPKVPAICVALWLLPFQFPCASLGFAGLHSFWVQLYWWCNRADSVIALVAGDLIASCLCLMVLARSHESQFPSLSPHCSWRFPPVQLARLIVSLLWEL